VVVAVDIKKNKRKNSTCIIRLTLRVVLGLVWCRQNPGYMKENFVICIESMHIGDTGSQDNVSDDRRKRKFQSFRAQDVVVGSFWDWMCGLTIDGAS
jgi:hypothetical protein